MDRRGVVGPTEDMDNVYAAVLLAIDGRRSLPGFEQDHCIGVRLLGALERQRAHVEIDELGPVNGKILGLLWLQVERVGEHRNLVQAVIGLEETIERNEVLSRIELALGNDGLGGGQTAPAQLDPGVRTIGVVVVHSLPPEVATKVSQARSHSFFIKDGNNAIVLVSPNDRRVADVIH
jgi:hypothetical protein